MGLWTIVNLFLNQERGTENIQSYFLYFTLTSSYTSSSIHTGA
jgi:hypothetical protein